MCTFDANSLRWDRAEGPPKGFLWLQKAAEGPCKTLSALYDERIQTTSRNLKWTGVAELGMTIRGHSMVAYTCMLKPAHAVELPYAGFTSNC